MAKEEVNETNEQVEEETQTTEEVNETSETTEETNEKTFTQAELDEIIAKRIERVNKKYSDYNDLKTKATQFEKEAEERRLAELSEKERAEELAKKYEEEKGTLEQQLEDFRSQVKNEKIRNDFIKKAQTANIAYVDDAITLADLSGVNVNEDGNVEGVDDVIQSLIENKPFLLAKKQQKPIGEATSSEGSTNEEAKTLEAQLADAKEKKDFNKVIEISNKIKQFMSPNK